MLIQPLAMGDLLMTTPLLAGLKAKYPEAGIDVMANDFFARVLAGNPRGRRIHTLPIRGALPPANNPPTGPRRPSCPSWPAFWDLSPSATIGSSTLFHDLAGALTFLSRGGRVLGADFTKEGYLIMRGDWPSYLRMVLGGPCFNSFNTADIHCLAAGVRPQVSGLRFYPTENDRREADELLGGLGAESGDSLIALHLGATREHRRWPLDEFVELGRLLLAKGYRPVLTGGAAEADMTAQAARGMGPGVLQTAGRTENLGAFAALLKRCRAIVSNDSGPVHVAASVKTPVVSISLGKAQFQATGPYLSGSLALEADMACAPCFDPDVCAHHDCHRAITARDALAALEYLLGGAWVPPPGCRTKFYQAQTAPDGLLDWRPLLQDKDQPIRAALRRAWLAVLQPGSSIMAPKPPEPPPSSSEPWKQFDLLASQAVRILRKMQALLSGRADMSALSGMSSELASVSQRIKDLGMAESMIKPLAAYLILRKSGLDEIELAIQIAGQLNLYLQVRRAARLAAGNWKQTKARPDRGCEADLLISDPEQFNIYKQIKFSPAWKQKRKPLYRQMYL